MIHFFEGRRSHSLLRRMGGWGSGFNLIDEWICGGGRDTQKLLRSLPLSLLYLQPTVAVLLPADVSGTPRSVPGRETSRPPPLSHENKVSSSTFQAVINLINCSDEAKDVTPASCSLQADFRRRFSLTFNCLAVRPASCRETQFMHPGGTFTFPGCWR